MARLLVVDDEESIRAYVKQALAVHGYEIVCAKDGADALRVLGRYKVDAMITDIRMPVMDGISLSLQARSMQPHLRILLMTGYVGELERAHNIGILVDRIITKPFTIESLMTAVRNLFAEPVPVAPFSAQSLSSERSQSGMSSRASKASRD